MYALLLFVALLSPVQPSPKSEHPRIEHPHGNSNASDKANQKRDRQPQATVIVNQDSDSPTGQQDSNNKKQTDDDRTHEKFYRAYVIFTIIGSLAAVAALVVLIFQTRATRIAAYAAKKTADTTERALQISERADVLLDQAGFNTGSKILPESRIILTYRNFGRTRAKNVLFEIRLSIPGVPDYPGDPLPEMTIGANNTQTVSFHSFKQYLNEKTFNDVCSGRIEMKCTAQVTYRDIFDATHHARDEMIFYARARSFIVEKHESD